MNRSDRLRNIQEYYFSGKLREVRALAARGKPIINMGVGSPDLQPPEAAVAAIRTAILETDAHTYQPYQGVSEFREAIADFYQNNYRVAVNPENEVLPLMGSKEGILQISMAFLNKGEGVLIPNPGYPTYTSVSHLLEARPVFYGLKRDQYWQPNFEELAQKDLSTIKLMWVNYPHMPTGGMASIELFEKLITFGKKYNILIVNDNPYSFVLTNSPLSILRVDGAKETALELNSLSKSFNMAGWRVGMLLGSKDLLAQVSKVTTQMDSGMFYGIQKGAIAALKMDSNWFQDINERYRKRRKLVWKMLSLLHCRYDQTSSGMFVWAKIPKGKTSKRMVDDLLYNKSIFMTPGTVFGSEGEGYIRCSLCVSQEKIAEAISRL